MQELFHTIAEWSLGIGLLLSATIFSPANIEDKGVGDAFSSEEFNEMVTSIGLFYRDDNDTPTDDTDDLLGIGNATPVYKLDVAGDIHATGDLRSDGELYVTKIYGDGSGLTNVVSQAEWIRTADDINYPDGNVGIGIASPTENLHIVSTEGVTLKIEADTDNTTETDNAAIEFSQDGGGVTGYVGFEDGQNNFSIVNQHNDDLFFGTNGFNRLNIDRDGLVGIGTNDPDTKLDIRNGELNVSATNNSEVSGRFTSLDDENYLRIASTNTAPSAMGIQIEDRGTIVASQRYDLGQNSWQFYAGGNTASELAMSIKNNGRVGIGVPNPDEMLHVDGNIQWGNALLTTDEGGSIELGGASSSPYIDFKNDASSDYDVRLSLTGNDTLEIAGGTLLVAEPTMPGEVATKNYVDQNRIEFVEVTNASVTNVNIDGGALVAFSTTPNHNTDSSLFIPIANGVQVATAGTYEVVINLYVTSTVQRSNIATELTINGAPQGIRGAGAYMRSQGGHNESSAHVSQILTVGAGDVIGVQTERLAVSGTVALPVGKSNLMIKKLR